jgi:hypothetical protein
LPSYVGVSLNSIECEADEQRHGMETGPLCKLEVQRIVGIHLGMYLPPSPDGDEFPTDESADKPIVVDRPKLEREDTEALRSIKEEDEDEDTLVDIGDTK